MENTNNSSHETSCESVKLRVYLHPFDSFKNEDYILTNEHVVLVENEKSSHISIIQKNETVTLKYQIKNEFEHISCRNGNLKNCFIELIRLITKDSPKIHKKIEYNKKLNLTLIRFFNEFESSESIIDFCQNLTFIPFFSDFNSIQLYTHKKGFTKVQKHYISKSQINKSDIPTTEFNKLFTAIKKSKNGSFGQSTLKSYDFEIIGTCLAKSFTIYDYNIVFLISKNEFLPQEDSDILIFNEITHFLPYFFNILLHKKDVLDEISVQKATLQSFEISDDKSIDQTTVESAINKLKESSFSLFDVNHNERISLLGELLNTLRHELSNPLFGLQLSADLLEDEIDEPEMLNEVKLAISRCQEILSNFSELYLEESKQNRFDLLKLINEVITLTKSRTKHIQKLIQLDGNIINKETQFEIYSNKNVLAQVFFNLIINSSQAFDEDSLSPVITINIISKVESKLLISISDNGPGLPKNIIDKVFTPFFTTKKEGTGLGLSICKNLIYKIGGKISYISSDKGANFLLELPYENSSR